MLRDDDLNTQDLAESSADEQMAKMMAATTKQLNEMGKKFKVTVKKTYINDILMYSKSAKNVSQKIIVVISDSLVKSNQYLKKRAKKV